MLVRTQSARQTLHITSVPSSISPESKFVTAIEVCTYVVMVLIDQTLDCIPTTVSRHHGFFQGTNVLRVGIHAVIN
jgi:hypothetical protein